MKSNDPASKPLVSVIMATWNSARYLDAAIASLTAQTYPYWELVVVNDCSTDDTAEVLERLQRGESRIRVFNNEVNIRQTRTRNLAISEARGTYVTLLDSDDERKPMSLELQVDFLERNPETVVVGTGAEWCDESMHRLNDRLYPLTDEAIRHTFFRYSPFCLASMMIRVSALDSPAYDPEMEPAEDIDLAMRLGTKGQLANLPDALYRVRTHPQSVTQRGMRVMEKNTFRIRRKAVREYGYRMRPVDLGLNALQYTSMYLMPPRARFALFNRMRSSR